MQKVSSPRQFWQNKVALVSGGSSGIGLAMAKQLAAQGACVWILARNEGRLVNARREIEAERANPAQFCEAISVDVSDAQQVADAIQQITAASPALDLVVNSAGVVHPGYVEELPIEKFHWMMDINYYGIVHVVKVVLPTMLERGSGHIINIASGAAFAGVFGYSAYSPTKFAIHGFSGALRSELKRRGITVSVAFPPDTDTPQLAYENQFKPRETKVLAGKVKPMTADAVATAILRQAAQGKFLILPNFDIWLLYTLSRWMGASFYSFMDWLLARGLRTGRQ
jgi:3-dehydrosphinganine reductase